MASLPLRIFLGIIFFFAGLDKVTDPTFFDATNANYIGKQLQGFVTYNHSPLSGLLTNLAIPNAALFGWLMAIGEMVVGLAVLAGLFTRMAAAAGLLISLTLWLTASWGQQPFYTNWDLPYIFGWVTLILLGAGSYSVDAMLVQRRGVNPETEASIAARRRFLVQAGAIAGGFAALLFAGGEVLSTFTSRGKDAVANTLSGDKQAAAQPSATRAPAAPAATDTPPPAAAATDTPAAAATDTAATAEMPIDTVVPEVPSDTPVPAAADTPVPAPAANTLVPAQAAPQGTLIASASDVPVGGGSRFTDSAGNDAWLVHLSDDRYAAFSALCTHDGCAVSYSGSSQIFSCPCHGAQFDAANDGAVLRRPARRALAKLNINVDSSGNVYYVG